MRKMLLVTLVLTIALSALAQKKVYVPNSLKNMDLNKSSSQWCYARSKESDNVVVFWESGFGSDPSSASGSYRVNMDALLAVAEKCYSFYVDSLRFAIDGSSVLDQYKLMIFLMYSTDWAASGSGQDDIVGSLQVNPAAANIDNVVAHELGHCFQYITGCDTKGGYRYGFGENMSGGNGFWEQCAQWMSFKVYPQKQFTESDFTSYVKSNHLHILHETPRYANYFIPDYWTFKHGITFLGKLWRESLAPEDPVETYKRLNSLSQEQFNDEIYEHAARLTTWDLPAIRSYGEKYVDKRGQVKMSQTSDNYWQVDPSVCIENYGYNSIKLNAPSHATQVTVHFKGKSGASGFRSVKTDKGGWRFGFVALLSDASRVYSDIGSAHVESGNNPEQSLSFDCPDNCSKLWLIVSGAPQEHWRHAWDDNNSNDEQWPYQVQFTNTNLLGEITGMVASVLRKPSVKRVPVMLEHTIILPEQTGWRITDLAGKQIETGYGSVISVNSLANGGYILHCSVGHMKFLKAR